MKGMNNILIMKVNVSVIIPIYNSEKTIERAVLSIANQTVLPLELIIVDDCSTNKNIKHILESIKEQYEKYFDIKTIFLNSNQGPATARNKGWDLAKGEYIAFLDSDDIWYSKKLEVQYNYMKKNKEIFFSYHHMDILEKFIDKDVHFFKTSVVNINPYKFLFKHYAKGNTSCVMIKNVKSLRFMNKKRYFEDYLLWLEYNFKYKGVLLDVYMAGSFKKPYGVSGLSKDLWNMEKGELNTFKILLKKRYINYVLYVTASTFSLIKFIRRKVICKIR